MANGSTEDGQSFSIEADVVKLNELEERLMIEGHIGGTDQDRFCRGLVGDKGT